MLWRDLPYDAASFGGLLDRSDSSRLEALFCLAHGDSTRPSIPRHGQRRCIPVRVQLGDRTHKGKRCLIARLEISATNIDEGPISIVKASIGTLAVETALDTTPSPIRPGGTARRTALFYITPTPLYTIGKPFVADVDVIDQYGRLHRVPQVAFRSLLVK